MDFMYAYFPLIKGAIGLMMVLAIYLSFKKGYKKLGFGLLAFALVFTWYSPVKVDGTNTKLNHKLTHAERTTEYNDVADEAVVVVTKKETFAERMAKEDERSKSKSKEIADEIKSIQSN